MRPSIIFILAMILLIRPAAGSGPFASWHHWTFEVSNLSCDMRKEYSNPSWKTFTQAVSFAPDRFSGRSSLDKGGLAGTIYGRVLAGFSINVRTHGKYYPASLVGKNRFYLFLYPEDQMFQEQFRDPDGKPVISVTVNGKNATTPDGTAYWLTPEQTTSVFESHTRDEDIRIILTVEGGDTTEISMSAFPRNQFKVWAAMIETCARENVD